MEKFFRSKIEKMSDSEEFYDPKGDTTEEGGYSSDSESNAVRDSVLYLFYLLKRCYEM